MWAFVCDRMWACVCVRMYLCLCAGRGKWQEKILQKVSKDQAMIWEFGHLSWKYKGATKGFRQEVDRIRFLFRRIPCRVPALAQGLTIRLGTMRLRVRFLASISGLRIRCCREFRSQTWLGSAWLWLCCRPALVAPIQPLSWETTYAVDVALKRKKKKVCMNNNYNNLLTKKYSILVSDIQICTKLKELKNKVFFFFFSIEAEVIFLVEN